MFISGSKLGISGLAKGVGFTGSGLSHPNRLLQGVLANVKRNVDMSHCVFVRIPVCSTVSLPIAVLGGGVFVLSLARRCRCIYPHTVALEAATQ